MVSLSLGLLLLLALLALLEAASSHAQGSERSAELASTGRFALAALQGELRQAGYRGYTAGSIHPPNPFSPPEQGCALPGLSVAAFLARLEEPVWGQDNANPFSGAGNCLHAASYVPGTDVLVLRCLATVAASGLAPGGVYFYSAYGQGQMFMAEAAARPPLWGPLPSQGLGLNAVFAVQVFVYYIGNSSSSDSHEPAVPGLWRLVLLADGHMERQLVASGVERMQLQYALASGGQLVFHDSLPSTPVGTCDVVSALATPVRAVRVWLLVRSARPEPGAHHAQSYAMGNQPYQVDDGYRRALFSSTVVLRN